MYKNYHDMQLFVIPTWYADQGSWKKSNDEIQCP